MDSGYAMPSSEMDDGLRKIYILAANHQYEIK